MKDTVQHHPATISRVAAKTRSSTRQPADYVPAAQGRAIGLTQTKRGFRMPRWQFEPSMWDAQPRLSAALGTTGGWAMLSFLESPHGALDGTTPRQAIEQGQVDKVVGIAEHEGN